MGRLRVHGTAQEESIHPRLPDAIHLLVCGRLLVDRSPALHSAAHARYHLARPELMGTIWGQLTEDGCGVGTKSDVTDQPTLESYSLRLDFAMPTKSTLDSKGLVILLVKQIDMTLYCDSAEAFARIGVCHN